MLKIVSKSKNSNRNEFAREFKWLSIKLSNNRKIEEENGSIQCFNPSIIDFNIKSLDHSMIFTIHK